jgi:hypothetical protein
MKKTNTNLKTTTNICIYKEKDLMSINCFSCILTLHQFILKISSNLYLNVN